MNLLDMAAVRRAQSALDMVGMAERRPVGMFSFARMISAMANGGLKGFERETLEEVANRYGTPFDRDRPFIPFELLAQRDLATTIPSEGGYLVDTSSLAATDVLRPYSVTTRLGVTVTNGLIANAELPVTTTKVTPQWLGSDSAQLTESTPALRSIGLAPKTAGAFLEMSRNFSAQRGAEAFARRELLNTVGTTVDLAVLAGSGVSGEPLGITNVAGIGTEAGTSLAHANVVSMKRKVSAANAPDEGIAFIGTPVVRELLEARARATGLGFIWDNDKVASRPAAASTSVPTDKLICAHWPSVHLLLWGAGFQVELNPYDAAGFKSGIIQARVLVSCDVAAVHPATICVASSVT